MSAGYIITQSERLGNVITKHAGRIRRSLPSASILSDKDLDPRRLEVMLGLLMES